MPEGGLTPVSQLGSTPKFLTFCVLALCQGVQLCSRPVVLLAACRLMQAIFFITFTIQIWLTVLVAIRHSSGRSWQIPWRDERLTPPLCPRAF